jgi:hypothetical protein
MHMRKMCLLENELLARSLTSSEASPWEPCSRESGIADNCANCNMSKPQPNIMIVLR